MPDYLARLYNVRPFDGLPDDERIVSQEEMDGTILMAELSLDNVQVQAYDNGDVEVFNADGGIYFLRLPDDEFEDVGC